MKEETGNQIEIACRICGSNLGGPLLARKQRGQNVSQWSFCQNCESAHIEPYPSEDDMTRYYNSNYSEMDLAGANEGVNHKKRFSVEYESTVFAEYSFSLGDAGITAVEIKDKSLKVFDYGCATGGFLNYLASMGVSKKNLFGYDIGSDMVLEASSKGYDCTANLSDIDGLSFDLITLWDVIEHVSHPKEVVKWVKSHLNHNGSVLVQTPHFSDLAINLGEAFSHYLVVEHLHLFSRKALIDLFELEGMRCSSQSSFGANAYAKSVAEPHKTAYDKLAKKYDFGATQVLLFRMED